MLRSQYFRSTMNIRAPPYGAMQRLLRRASSPRFPDGFARPASSRITPLDGLMVGQRGNSKFLDFPDGPGAAAGWRKPPARRFQSPATRVRKSLVFGTSNPVFNRGGFQLVRCPLWVTSRRKAAPILMSALRGEADGDQRPSERPLLAISGHWHRQTTSQIGTSRCGWWEPSTTSGAVTQVSLEMSLLWGGYEVRQQQTYYVASM